MVTSVFGPISDIEQLIFAFAKRALRCKKSTQKVPILNVVWYLSLPSLRVVKPSSRIIILQ
jgi:hypothetical protein